MQKRIYLILLSLFSFHFANATHIVGGVMNYKYLGNDKYEISLFVYRDCKNGIPPLDDPAIIRVWDGVTESYYGFSVPFDDTLPLIQPDPCARIDSGSICVNWTNYKDTLILPPNDFGYTVYYQRCCRNNTIQNLTYNSRGNGAMDWGATYAINIPASTSNQPVANSSPIFVNYPPIYICVNKPILYDNSAIDADGDSLVYRLCTPYSGAYPSNPLNYYTEETPPFEPVEWSAPYSESNMLGGVPLSVNPKTGLLTGTPNTIGQFVVGVCVDEYRNGILLTHTIRDFQFNVIDCNLQIISSFFAPDIECNSFTVNFQNQSSGATAYKWYFGDGDSSTLSNPSHTYAQTGIYTVTLVSINTITNTCIAKYSKTISIQYKKIKAEFTTQENTCLQAGDAIQFLDRSTDSFNVASWHWTFSNGDSSNIQNPILYYNGLDTAITATLLVTSTNGCTSSITKTIKLFKKPTYTLQHVLTKCTNTGKEQISLSMNGNNIFYWYPSAGLNNPTLQNPTTSINSNITYNVIIKSVLANGDTCVQYDSVQVKTINTIQINTSDTLKVCNDSVRLSVPVSNGQSVIWSTSNNFVPIIGTTANISIFQTIPSQKYYVKITAQDCETTDSILVLFSNIIPKIDLADNILQCTNRVQLTASIDHSDSIIWSKSPIFNSILSSSNPFDTIQQEKTAKYYIKAFYQSCSNTDSIRITVQDTLPSIVLADTLNICGGDIIINAAVQKFTSILWSNEPSFNTIIGNGKSIYIMQTIPQQKYYIRAFYRDCFITDSVVVNYNITPPSIMLDDSSMFCSNQVSANAIINNAENIMWSTHSDFTNIISTHASFSTTQQQATQIYYVKATSKNCIAIDSIKIKIPSNPITIDLDKTIFVCADSVRINALISNYDSLIWSQNNLYDTIISRESHFNSAQQTAQQKYYLKVYHDGCTAEDSTTVFYSDSVPTISLFSPNHFCSDSVFAYAYVDFSTETEWFDSRDFSHLIGTNLTLQITQPLGKKWYYFRAKYKNCVAVDSIELENNSIKYNKTNYNSCLGDSLQINLNATSTTDFQINWHLANDSITTINSSTIKIQPNSTQTIYFQLKNSATCLVDDSILVTVNPIPTINATVDKPSIFIGEQVQLMATQNQNYSYNWQPADLVNNNAIYNPISSPQQTTLYTISITDNNNCKNSDTVSVQIMAYECSSSNIYIPNAFSPNGDGINDVLFVRATGLKTMHLEIFDRWGHKVFQSDNLNDGWNGTYKGQPVPVDSYGYTFSGECFQGEKINLKGNITLLK